MRPVIVTDNAQHSPTYSALPPLSSPFAHCPGVAPASALTHSWSWGQSQGKLGGGGPSRPECSWTVQNTPRAHGGSVQGEGEVPLARKLQRPHSIVVRDGGPRLGHCIKLAVPPPLPALLVPGESVTA